MKLGAHLEPEELRAAEGDERVSGEVGVDKISVVEQADESAQRRPLRRLTEDGIDRRRERIGEDDLEHEAGQDEAQAGEEIVGAKAGIEIELGEEGAALDRPRRDEWEEGEQQRNAAEVRFGFDDLKVNIVEITDGDKAEKGDADRQREVGERGFRPLQRGDETAHDLQERPEIFERKQRREDGHDKQREERIAVLLQLRFAQSARAEEGHRRDEKQGRRRNRRKAGSRNNNSRPAAGNAAARRGPARKKEGRRPVGKESKAGR